MILFMKNERYHCGRGEVISVPGDSFSPSRDFSIKTDMPRSVSPLSSAGIADLFAEPDPGAADFRRAAMYLSSRKDGSPRAKRASIAPRPDLGPRKDTLENLWGADSGGVDTILMAESHRTCHTSDAAIAAISALSLISGIFIIISLSYRRDAHLRHALGPAQVPYLNDPAER